MGIIKDVILHDEETMGQEKTSKYELALTKYNTAIDDNAVRDAVRNIIAEKVSANDTIDVKKFLFGSIELTTLKTTDSDTSVLASPSASTISTISIQTCPTWLPSASIRASPTPWLNRWRWTVWR